MQVVACHHVVADGDGQSHLASGLASKYPNEGRLFRLQLKRQVLDVLGIQVEHGANGVDATNRLELLDQFALDVACGFALEGLDVFGHFRVGFEQVVDGLRRVCGSFQHGSDACELLALVALRLHGGFTGQGFNATNASRDGAFALDAEGADGSGGWHVDASAELLGGTKLDHAHGVPVLLPKQHHGSGLLGLGDGHLAVFLAGVVGQDA